MYLCSMRSHGTVFIEVKAVRSKIRDPVQRKYGRSSCQPGHEKLNHEYDRNKSSWSFKPITKEGLTLSATNDRQHKYR